MHTSIRQHHPIRAAVVCLTAMAAVLAKGMRTADIKSEGTTAVSTAQMGEAILKELQASHS